MKPKWWMLLPLVAALVMAGGCFSARKKKKDEGATLRIYLQTSATMPAERRYQVVFSKPSITFWVDNLPELSEMDLVGVDKVAGLSGLQIKLIFNHHGQFVLENLTGSNRGKFIAVVVRSATLGPAPRPIAAIRLQEIRRDGVLVITPNLTDEQTEALVKALRETISGAEKEKMW